jgi:alkanesulfonate monooxygenase SsuD/methylene tetrahydromethanopterin reductase-like flavin-dependent oxidoreductase (luciferase family)
MWTHPHDHSTEYNTIEYWQGLARLAERGKFDGIFLADIVGVYDVYRGGPAPSIVDAVQISVNDPMMVVPVMAAITEHIGFGVTANLTYEPPYLFARRMSTLDHLTRGRVGWNIVTGYLDSAARGMGLAAQPDHDGRYDAADEYMSVVYQLWEASWEGFAGQPILVAALPVASLCHGSSLGIFHAARPSFDAWFTDFSLFARLLGRGRFVADRGFDRRRTKPRTRRRPGNGESRLKTALRP